LLINWEIAPPSITLLVNSLVQDGYVERRTNAEDRRSVQISLTKKGLQALNQCTQFIHARLERIVDYLGVEKSNLFSDLLSEICKFFKEPE
jgi:DNA-binding MarR family transcriptional regulator